MIEHSRRLGAVCVGAALSVLGFALFGAEITDTDPAGWVEALATLGALVAAVVAATYAAGAFRLEATREQRWADTQLRAQAELVAGWLGSQSVVLMNQSTLPIYRVQVIVLVEGRRGTAERVDLVPPTGLEGRPIRVAELKALHSQARTELAEAGKNRAPTVRVIVEFTDAGGHRWLRDAQGNLSYLARPKDDSSSKAGELDPTEG